MRTLICIGLFFLAALGTAAKAESSYYYVANTRPPDAYLSLRTLPSASRGRRIKTMPNGTLLEVLQRRDDAWWFVREVRSGARGWVLSRQGDRVWIECCKSGEGTRAEYDFITSDDPQNRCLLRVNGQTEFEGPCQITTFGDGSFRFETDRVIAIVNVTDSGNALSRYPSQHEGFASWQWKPVGGDDYVRGDFGVKLLNELGIGRIDYDDMPEYDHCWGSDTALQSGKENYTNVCISFPNP